MCDRTAEMGLEMFVLDDGWFGGEFPRDDSSAGLGDWQVNRRKLPAGIDYVEGFYRVMRRICAKHPDVLVQACSSGGGRVDYGVLKYFDEVWTSDNTEALTRLYIQYGANLIYPAMVTGAHVSAVPNHQTGNATSLKFRFDVASAGRPGMEPQQMTDAERAFARRAVASYAGYRDLVFRGDLYRFASPYDPRKTVSAHRAERRSVEILGAR